MKPHLKRCQSTAVGMLTRAKQNGDTYVKMGLITFPQMWTFTDTKNPEPKG